MYMRISKATGETRASLDQTTIGYMLDLYEAIEYEDYLKMLDHKESENRHKQQEHAAKLKKMAGIN